MTSLSNTTSETIFRLIFLLGFATAVSIATRGARRAQKQHGKPLNQLQNEVPILIPIRAALGIVFYASLIVWLLNIHRMSWSFLSLPIPMRWCGAVMMTLTLFLFYASFDELGANYRGGVGLYPAHALVTTGAYRWIRHPIYVSFVIIMVAATLLSANWLLGLSGLLLVSSIAAVRIPIEERELRERFADEWQSYEARTGCVFPRFTVGRPQKTS